MKLIDLLVEELPKRGGWPVNISYIAQDEGFATWGFRYKPERDSDGEWMDTSESGYEMEIVCIGSADDCNTSVVSREQYEAYLAASKAVVGHDGWIQWAGGDCPVDSEAIVEVKYRWHNQHQYSNGRAGDFDWAHTGSSCDIIAYLLHDQDISSRANYDRLEQDLNECIGQDIDMPEWNGVGLPPVGIECEWQDKNTKQWQPVKVVYSSEWVTVVREINKEKGDDLVEVAIENYGDESRRKFRPLRTEAENAREAAIQDLTSVICGNVPDTGMATAAMYAERVYDAGYRKEVK